MIEEIQPNICRIEVPLPGLPLKSLNSYLIRSDERNLIIDTGLNCDESFEAMKAGMEKLGVNPAQTDFFISHHHADHIGLVPRLASESSKVYMSRHDAAIIQSWQGFDSIVSYSENHGFPKNRLSSAFKQYAGIRFGSEIFRNLIISEDGDPLCLGEYYFRCVHTPGHTGGHMCLYEPQHKILFSGDHVLMDISSNIQCFRDTDNPLKDYFDSLDKVSRLEVSLVLPGHRRIFSDHRKRITGLISHHKKRLDEILDILNGSPRSAYETASEMTWDFRADSWTDFPIAHQWFATGEALAHLRYLEEDGRVIRENNKTELRRFLRRS
ncbi:MBL fold metallo-hydrolase [Desulfonema ishimotonii]|uniref:MBL fold metallo-hydrolase n=1 Tax=Desulfonema ishimotonii TaxID=45657 RepID=A0A401FY33_9BACT|nr:MBL fold metallo-hydrolase [Desulfonema ishimotonii]GBC61856.1 MBL fold metallo-hydrolase [Desulfonema ishimotonii]